MVKLNDGSFLMAREKEILEVFTCNHIIGRTITGIFPKEMNYGISNWDDLMEEIDDISAYTNECGIQTDDFVFLELDYGKWLAIQFAGSGGPVIMKMMSGNDPYPKIPADLFSLNTLFHDCRHKKIANIIVDHNGGKMWFPCFSGVDMSAEDEGVWRVRLILEDGSCLAFYGSVDWSCVGYLDELGEPKRVPMAWLCPKGPEAMAAAIDEGNYEKILALLIEGVDYPVVDPLWEWSYLWSLQYTGDYPEDNEIRLQIAEQLLKNGESPIVEVEGETLLDYVCYRIFNDSMGHEELEYLRKFMILLIAYGGHTEYCNPQIIRPFDLDHLSKYRFVVYLEPDGYHLSGQVRDDQNHIIAIL